MSSNNASFWRSFVWFSALTFAQFASGLCEWNHETCKKVKHPNRCRWGNILRIQGTSCGHALSNYSMYVEVYSSCSLSYWHVFYFQDGLFLVTNNLDLVSGYALAVLTPNVNEYKRLVQKILSSEVNDLDAPQQLLSLSKQ